MLSLRGNIKKSILVFKLNKDKFRDEIMRGKSRYAGKKIGRAKSVVLGSKTRDESKKKRWLNLL